MRPVASTRGGGFQRRRTAPFRLRRTPGAHTKWACGSRARLGVRKSMALGRATDARSGFASLHRTVRLGVPENVRQGSVPRGGPSWARLAPTARTPGNCGILGASVKPPTSVSSGRIEATFSFIDIAGFTAHTEEHGDEKAADLA